MMANVHYKRNFLMTTSILASKYIYCYTVHIGEWDCRGGAMQLSCQGTLGFSHVCKMTKETRLWVRICKCLRSPRIYSKEIDSGSLCSLAGWFDKQGYRNGPPATQADRIDSLESIPCNRFLAPLTFTNSASGYESWCAVGNGPKETPRYPI